MRPEDLRAYMRRDWDRVDAHKRSRWRARGALANFVIAGEIYAQVRRARPNWPTRDSRRADLDHHLALSDRLRGIARRRPAR